MDNPLCFARESFRRVQGLDAGPAPAFGDFQPADLNDWAHAHRIQAMLHAGLPEEGLALQSAAFGRAHHSARWTTEAERLFELLSPSIPSLALIKGPSLARQAWPDPALRSFDDLDFLCARRDGHRIQAGMARAGYQPALADARRRAHRWHYGWGMAFRHPEGFLVEFKFRFMAPHYPWPSGLDAQRNSAFIRQPLDHRTVRAPSPSLHLLLCSLHAIWHGWARLSWMADIAGLLVRHPEAFSQAMEWAASCACARQALSTSGALAEALFGPGICAARAPESIVDQAVRLLDGTQRALHGPELRAFHEQFMTGAEKRIYLMRRIFIPGDGDFLWMALPAALRFLYWPLRPIRGMLYGRR